MSASLDFLLGLLEHTYPAHVAWEDFTGAQDPALRGLQGMGLLSQEAGRNPVASCPHCAEGVPYRLGERFLCTRCRSTIDQRHLLLWRLDLDAFLVWLAEGLKLQGGVRHIDRQLWQLGTGTEGDWRFECFYYRGGALTEAEKQRLAAYRQAVVLYGLTRPGAGDHTGPVVSLLELLDLKRTLTLAKKPRLFVTRGAVRFDRQTGALQAGDLWLGEVPVLSKEHAFLTVLADRQDRFVPYADLKTAVLQRTGSQDTTEEATFCQKLKSRIKKKWVSNIDQLIVANKKEGSYRLRRMIGSWQ